MADGNLKAEGTSLFLKNHYGKVYQLSLQSMKAAEFEELKKLDSKIIDLISENYQREQSSNLHTIPRNQ
jgi:hypothetical protein